MINRIIEYSIHNRYLVIFISLVVAVLGVICMQQVNLDAIPDLSDPQVIILSEYPGQAPQVVEDQVTYPLTTAMLSVPKAKNVRGYSFFGFSLVYIIFEDGTDMYWARSRVLEYINFAKDKLPSQVSPALGPDATGVGWVYEYALVSDQHDLSELRSLQDWFIRFELSSVKGVSEVASVGGYVKQYQVEVDPNRLAAFGVNLSQIKQAIQRSNNDVGGKLIELSETEYMVRGLGYIKSLSDLEHIPIKTTQDGTPILIKNVANVQLGPDLRRGAAELNGEGEVAGGIVVMRYGENALEVINRVKQKLKEVKKGLPEGVEIVTTYDRSGLIERAVSNLSWKLIEEILIVALVCFIFLLHIPSVFISVLTLPLGILIAFIIMRLLGINANIMSLGGIAIAIGVMVDAAVVLVENTHKRLHQAMRSGELTAQKRIEVVIEASKEVGPSLFYALLIITVSFLPVFALEAQEGRLFKPLAFTKTFAMAASSLLAITIIPALLAIFVRGKIKDPEKNRLNKTLMKWYSPLLKKSLRFPKVIWGGAFLLLLITVIPYKYIGSEFMPPLNEGDLLYMPTTLPGISITKAKELLQQTSAIIKSHPEVTLVFGKVGRAKTATDPAPLSMIETTILLKDPKDWRSGMTIDKIRKELNEMVQFPGVTNSWTMPIKTRIDMLSTGIKTPVGIKLIGEDLEGLAKWGEEVESVLKTVPGTLSVFSERATGGYYLDFDIDREEAARHGLTTGDIQDVIQSAVGGMNVSMVIDGLERYPINVRYPRELRETPEDLERILIMTPTGAHIPLKQVASLEFKNGPPAIKTENARKTAWIYVDLDEVDIGSYVKNAKQVVNEKIKFPPGYAMIWSGQFEFMERAAERLKLVIPLTILLILFLLFIHFKSVIDTFIVMLSIPFSLVGGIWLMWALEYEISVAVAVGFISLLGLATETGVVMLVYLNQAYKDYLATEGEKSIATFDLAILKGATLRLRPVLMTVSTTLIGLVTVMIGSGTGTSVMQRIAAPMVGGLLTSTVLTLILIPVIFKLIKQRALDL